MEVNKQTGGDGSQNIQAGSVTVNVVAVVKSVEEIIPHVFESTFASLSKKSQEEAQSHQSDFMREFQDKLESLAGDVKELQTAVETPDFQYMAKKSLVVAGRMASGEKRKLLASLLGDRLITKTDFGEIVYNEALETVSKLTDRQIKILTLQCGISQLSQQNIPNWEAYNEQQKTLLKYTLPLNLQQSDLQHISYSGCGNSGPFSKGLVQEIREKYENLFMKPIKSDESIFAEIQESLLIKPLFSKEGEDLIFQTNRKWFEKLNEAYKGGFDASLVEKILPLYASKVMNDEEALEIIKTKCFMGTKLVDAWDSKNLKHLSLTSVGIIIGVSVIEEITQSKVDKDAWLGA